MLSRIFDSDVCAAGRASHVAPQLPVNHKLRDDVSCRAFMLPLLVSVNRGGITERLTPTIDRPVRRIRGELVHICGLPRYF